MKISRINFSPFKEESATNSIQISWIEREENYIALNDRPYFPKLPKQNGTNHLIFDPIDRAQCSATSPGLNGNYPFRLFLIYDKKANNLVYYGGSLFDYMSCLLFKCVQCFLAKTRRHLRKRILLFCLM